MSHMMIAAMKKSVVRISEFIPFFMDIITQRQKEDILK